MKITHGTFRAVCALPLILLLAGCGDDRPSYQPPRPTPRAAPRPVAAAPPPSSDPTSPPSAPDALLSGTEPAPQADGLGSDGDLFAGRKMPTQHSHWLSVSLSQARVTVRLNGAWYKDFYVSGLRDITMRLRPGLNTITIGYVPKNNDSWLAVHLTEGEHDPPIPDLVTYKIPPLRDALLRDPALSTSLTLSPTTRTFPFHAR